MQQPIVRDARIVIIGAGAAGLAAAHELSTHGLQPLVLEARKRLGGRIWTLHEPDLPAPVELGAEFVHGAAPEISGSRALSLDEMTGDTWHIRRGRRLRGDGVFHEEMEGRPLFRVSGGCSAIIEPLAHGIDVATGVPVCGIRWSPQGARVETLKGDCRAERVIVTVPLPLLRDPEAFPFDPELPVKRAAAAQLATAKALRITIRFREDFWSERMPDLFMLSGPGETMRSWWTTHPLHSTLLTGWACDRKAANLSALPGRTLLGRALESLGRCLGEPARELEPLVERYWSHDWQSDPYSRGAYSAVHGDGVEAAIELARPAGRALFFAGEATATGGRAATIDGALSSGRRAGRQLLESLSM